MPATRQVFIGLSRPEIMAWYGLIVISTTIFVWGAARLVTKYRRGRPERLDHPWRRLEQMVETVFSHRWITRRDRRAGIGHALVFYGFLLLFAGTAILGLDSDFTVPVFHWSFWQGGFFLGYKLVLDIAGTHAAGRVGHARDQPLAPPARAPRLSAAASGRRRP